MTTENTKTLQIHQITLYIDCFIKSFFERRILNFTKKGKSFDRRKFKNILRKFYQNMGESEYIIGKLDQHKGDFIRMFCNRDIGYQMMILEALLGKDKYLNIENVVSADNSYTSHKIFEEFFLTAYNNAPLHVFELKMKNERLMYLFRISRIENFGNLENWSFFYFFLIQIGATKE